ncbi:MAG: PaaI family thioesterase [Alphaproteobacteria bacterium]|nr:PaaI family thioesterase [Alphaproteobacteria bacterium]
MDGAPAGWHRLAVADGFLATVGPLWWRRDGDGFAMGFRAAPQHCNPVGFCHGGMLITAADVVMGFGLGAALGTGGFVPTIGLAGDFLAPAPAGAFVAGRAEILRRGRRLGFAQCLLAADEVPVLRANGTFQLDRPADAGFSMRELFRDG